ncbi:NADH-quinone oxidoreductase subunit N [Bosea sp. 62]|uniref:NADH-quinone oxidoreductase subunit NuoN n=1 Tax=unclassified Bosea (in: a-proteobacteria) TaxID=2653178 RepID=UPI0012538E91|nr:MULTISPECIES: NADH-quinone oxidoreductase subunit NuoN [unclassified Bosea (in: a-proteobacteria)]CAD5257424.1 NADH-quinone oxidoreductase subunit N [Bosea sp. 46]CAD5261875.1 NADH-quinone oxidoreductase subunit N [Bosea sp. 21B]CAD5278666.1 NADH-quinone oxidoreductase subunit N [Bosea sp. 7B]VVT58575.1 NADH-quinone oxidoreductase subunit N [Bosea sp. EC-HK365B]VXB56726.1 NADH-quinone oxidoreductase subunit N [Bosea sp. 29B]
MTTLPAFGPALPEIVMALGAIAMVLYGAIQGERSTRTLEIAALALLALALVLVLRGEGKVVTFNGAFIADGFARFMKVLTLIGAAAAIVLSADFLRRDGAMRFEFPILVVLATIGMMMMISARDLIGLYVGLELQSLALYVVAAFDRDNPRSTEAGLKYFVLGALSSGMLLYGASMVYGFTGTVSYAGIAEAVKGGHPGIGLIIGLVFVAAGVAFKISAVPFHMWTPDVYEGAPTPVAAFFASAPKMAAMAMTVRIFVGAFPGALHDWQQIILFMSIASMALGAFAAIGQTNIKRLLAYSSIANMGYALVGLAAGTPAGVQGVMTYMAIYLATTLAAFACVLMMNRNGKPVEEIGELAGLSRTNGWMAFAMSMMMFSLAGIPPLAGFWAKWYVFLAAIEAKLYVLAVVGVITSVVGAYYYLRIVKLIYFDDAKPAFDKGDAGVRTVLLISALFVLVLSFLPAPLFDSAAAAAKSLF